MNNFKKIEAIKNNFQDSLASRPNFYGTKNILSNYSEFINRHKYTLYGLVGSSVIALAINSVQYFMENKAPTKVTQSYNSDYSQIDLSKQVVEFNKNIDMGNKVHQLKAFHTSGVDLNTESIQTILQLKVNHSIQIKNPFWEKSILEVKNTTGATSGVDNKRDGSYIDFVEPGFHYQVNHENANMLVDTSTYRISLDFDEINAFLNENAKKNDHNFRMDITKFVVYHEAAHAATRQSYNINPITTKKFDISGGELHSDLAALTLIGVETKSLERFNAVTDLIILMRVKTSLYHSDHNTTYGLVELKKAINENPELLNMKKEVVSEFAYAITDKMINKNFDSDPEIIAFKGNLMANKDTILHEMKSGKNTKTINYYAGKVLNKGIEGFKIDEYKAKNPERILVSVAGKIEKDLMKPSNYVDVASIAYLNQSQSTKTKNVKDFRKYAASTISKLTYNANTNPIIDSKMIAMFKTKINTDELQYDYSKIIEIAKELKESDHKNELSQKIGLKGSKFSS